MSVCVEVLLSPSLPDHAGLSLAGEGFVEVEGRTCAQKEVKRESGGGVGHSG